MTSIKISQLPPVSELSLDDVLIINDTSQNPVFTAKASVGQVLAFAESTLTFTTADVILVNPQQYQVGAFNPSDVVSIRPSIGVPDGNLPPLPPGGLTTQEDTNIYNVFALAALDQSIVDIQNDGAGVIEVTGGFGIKTDPLTGITGSGVVEVDPLQVVTITDEQVISGRKTFTDVATFNEKVYANNGITVKGDIVDTGNMTVSGNITAVQYFGDGSKWGIKINYIVEPKKLGTAGSLKLLPKSISNPFLVLNGDVLTRLNFRNLIKFHEKHNLQ